MRVIAGSRRSIPLKSPPGLYTRPTTDRIKETLFNIMSPYIPGCRFLDLFAGSGGIGIEALSRGASFCCFVDNNKNAVSVIRENLIKTEFIKKSEIIKDDAAKFSVHLGRTEAFDIVFMDPPYGRGLEKKALCEIKKTGFVNADTLYVIEASKDTDLFWIKEIGLECFREKIYKTNRHVFLRELK